MKQFQMLLSQNQKISSQFFSAFSKSTKNLEYFEKKDEDRKLFFSEIIGCKNGAFLNAEKAPCQNT